MNAAEKFVEGRGAISVRQLGFFLGRGHSYLYRAIGRGELRMCGPGKVTADSVIRWYEKKDQGREAPC